MIRSLRNPLIWIAIGLLAAVWTASPVLQAESPDAVTRELLEKSLSVVEIDKEIARLADQRQSLEAAIGRMEKELVVKEKEVLRRQEGVNEILRAYYTGDRDILLQAIFSSGSLTELFRMLEYFDWMFTRDKNILNAYKSQYRDLKHGKDALITEQERLASMQMKLVAQRARIAALHLEIDSELNRRGDSEQIQLMIEELTNFWNNVGMYEVRQYFNLLAEAMQELPSWLNENKQFLKLKGFDYTLRLPEKELNGFLRSQNAQFEFFSFRFEQDKLKVQGKRNGLEVEIWGSYTIEEKPLNAIRFHIEELRFNGLSLPETTRQTLEEEFDLGFYPHMIVSFVKAKSVEITDGELIVQLKLQL